jgi:hypothetical protein
MKKFRKTNRLIFAILASLLIHSLMVLGIKQVESLSSNTPTNRVTVEILSEPKKKTPNDSQLLKQQIVEQEEKPLNSEVPDKAKFLSANNQKILKETAATNKGEFKNLKKAQPKGDPQPAQVEKTKSEAKLAQSDKFKVTSQPQLKPKTFDPMSDMDYHFKEKQMEKTLNKGKLNKLPAETPVKLRTISKMSTRA